MVALTIGPPTVSMAATAILSCRPNSHAFQERKLILENTSNTHAAVKIGRSVARAKAASNNGIFDCKVLSRNHALLWYSNGKFYLQDTKSSNGTFVNNQRLSKTNEESAPHELCSGDIVQFGVDVIEANRSAPVTHGCIIANLKLYLPDGKEAKASCSSTLISTVPLEELHQLSSCIQEALLKETTLKSKLNKLQHIVTDLKRATDQSWKALIQEDRLLSRVEFLESQLASYSKSFTDDKLRDEIKLLHKDKATYESHLKEVMKDMLAEKVDVLQKCQETERKLSNVQNECCNLQELLDKNRAEMDELIRKYQDQVEINKELDSVNKELVESNEEKTNTLTKLQYETLQAQKKIDAFSCKDTFMRDKLKNYYTSFCMIKDNLSTVRQELNKEPNLDQSVLMKYFDSVQQLLTRFDEYFQNFNFDCDHDVSIKDIDSISYKLVQQLHLTHNDNELLLEDIARKEQKLADMEQSKVRHLDKMRTLELKLTKLKTSFMDDCNEKDKLKTFNCDTLLITQEKGLDNSENDIMCQMNENDKEYEATQKELDLIALKIDAINLQLVELNEEVSDAKESLRKNEEWERDAQEQLMVLEKSKSKLIDMKEIEQSGNQSAGFQKQLKDAKDEIEEFKAQRDTLLLDIENLREKLRHADHIESSLDMYIRKCETLQAIVNRYESRDEAMGNEDPETSSGIENEGECHSEASTTSTISLTESIDSNATIREDDLFNVGDERNESVSEPLVIRTIVQSVASELLDQDQVVESKNDENLVEDHRSSSTNQSDNENVVPVNSSSHLETDLVESELSTNVLIGSDESSPSIHSTEGGDAGGEDTTDDSSSEFTDSSTLIRVRKPKSGLFLYSSFMPEGSRQSIETQTDESDLALLSTQICTIDSHRKHREHFLFKVQECLNGADQLSPLTLFGFILMFLLLLASIVFSFENFFSRITGTYEPKSQM